MGSNPPSIFQYKNTKVIKMFKRRLRRYNKISIQQFGKDMAETFNYSGEDILLATSAALEDSNFHKEAQICDLIAGRRDITEKLLKCWYDIKRGT